MSAVDDTLDELAADFALLDDPVEQLGYVMELGKALPPLSEAEMVESNRVPGCSAPAWLVTEARPGGVLAFRGDSEALIPRGVIALLIKLYSGRTAAEILDSDARAALDRLGLGAMLSMNRVNGLASMAGRIRRDAAALQAA